MPLTIESTADDVQAALLDNEIAYLEQIEAIDAEAKRQRKEMLTNRIERRRALKALLKVVELTDATGGLKAVEDAAELAEQRGE